MSWSGSGAGNSATALQEAVQRHRQQLEGLAMAVASIERIDREVAELAAQRAEAVGEYEKLRAALTSGRAAGDAIAALGLTVGSKTRAGTTKSGRSRRRAAPKGGRAKVDRVSDQDGPATVEAVENERGVALRDVAAAGEAVGA